ncbi:MAG: hypothetical protein ACFB03_03600 [Paracoccaceae bacterium]
MSVAGESMELEAFLAGATNQIRSRIQHGVDAIADICQHLSGNLHKEPELRAQVDRLHGLVAVSLADAPFPKRRAIAHDAATLRDDIKRRWIDAEAPPMVGEIDDHLGGITRAIDDLTVGDAEILRGVARKIDALSSDAAQLDGIERRFVPRAIGATVMFLVGVGLVVFPNLVGGTARGLPMGLIILCLAGLPGVGAVYMMRVMPRMRADSDMETLNRQHFMPLGGVYFAEGDRPACVVPVEWSAELDEAASLAQPDPREVSGRAWRLW